jgi:hypothetical protein
VAALGAAGGLIQHKTKMAPIGAIFIQTRCRSI